VVPADRFDYIQKARRRAYDQAKKADPRGVAEYEEKANSERAAHVDPLAKYSETWSTY